MSGGRFDYSQRQIENIANDIEELLERQGKEKDKEDLFCDIEYYLKYPEEKFYYTYPKEVQDKMREAIKHLRIAYVYAQRVDWFLSGDDGEETFLERLEQDLQELKDRNYKNDY